MADDERDEETGAEQDGEAKRKQTIKWLVFGGILLVLISVSATGTYFVLQQVGAVEESVIEPEVAETEAVTTETRKPAIYFPLKPPIIVNFQARGRQRFLQAEVTLMTRDESVIQAIQLHMPMIRNSLVLLFGGQTYEELQTAEGKELLRQSALSEVRRLLEQESGNADGLEQVLFTDFVMQ